MAKTNDIEDVVKILVQKSQEKDIPAKPQSPTENVNQNDIEELTKRLKKEHADKSR